MPVAFGRPLPACASCAQLHAAQTWLRCWLLQAFMMPGSIFINILAGSMYSLPCGCFRVAVASRTPEFLKGRTCMHACMHACMRRSCTGTRRQGMVQHACCGATSCSCRAPALPACLPAKQTRVDAGIANANKRNAAASLPPASPAQLWACITAPKAVAKHVCARPPHMRAHAGTPCNCSGGQLCFNSGLPGGHRQLLAVPLAAA